MEGSTGMQDCGGGFLMCGYSTFVVETPFNIICIVSWPFWNIYIENVWVRRGSQKLTGASSKGILVGARRGEEALVGTSTEEDLLGGFCHTRKPYLSGPGSSAWGVEFQVPRQWMPAA